MACEKAVKSLNLPDVDLKNKIQTQLELMGYIDLTTKKPEDRRKLLITDVFPLVSKRIITSGDTQFKQDQSVVVKLHDLLFVATDIKRILLRDSILFRQKS